MNHINLYMFYATLPRLLSWKESDGFVIKLNTMNLESCRGIIQGVVFIRWGVCLWWKVVV